LKAVPLQEVDNPEFSDPGDYPVDTNNIAPRIGLSYDLFRGGALGAARRVRPVLRQDTFELISAIMTAGVYSTSFTALFPANAADPGPSQG